MGVLSGLGFRVYWEGHAWLEVGVICRGTKVITRIRGPLITTHEPTSKSAFGMGSRVMLLGGLKPRIPVQSLFRLLHMSGCQNYGPFLGP